MAQPLTDAINALTTYANSVTGASDTTLSEAVATLANGYGQGGGISIDEIASNGITGDIVITVPTVRANAFMNQNIENVQGNGVLTLEDGSFRGCVRLTTAMFTTVTTIKANTVYGCGKLTEARFPSLTAMQGSDHFRNCYLCEVIDLGSVAHITYESTFIGCRVLKALILRKTGSITTLGRGSWTSGNHPTLYDGTCKIYVPSALISSYISAANWSNLPNASSQFVALEGSPYEQPNFVYGE